MSRGPFYNASRLATSLMISAQTVTRNIDLLVDLLLVRRLQPFTSMPARDWSDGPKYSFGIRIAHTLLGVGDYARTVPSFYRTSARRGSISPSRT